MPKQLLKIDDFSGGTNGYSDPQNILDNELAQCSGFKAEPGEVLVIGDMKAAYTIGSGDTAAAENITIEPGYGLFSFSHDYDRDGNLASTNYTVIQKGNKFSIYDDTAHTWVKVSASDRFAFVNDNPDTITDSGNGFITAGFLPGMTILVSGAGLANNNGYHQIQTVAAGTLTLTAGSALSAEGAGAGVTIVGYHIDLGGSRGNNQMTTIKPCFFLADGALRVSPGDFGKAVSGTTITAITATGRSVNEYGDSESAGGTETTGAANIISTGDTIEVEGMEFLIAKMDNVTAKLVRNMHGLFPNNTSGTVAAFIRPDTRWFGLCKRNNFQGLTTLGTFTDWYGTFMHPRPPTDDMDLPIDPFVTSIQTQSGAVDIPLTSDTPTIAIGTHENTNVDATWDSTYDVWMTVLYDDVKQESQANNIQQGVEITTGFDWNFWVGVSYSYDGTDYEINKRITGARVYYEDIINERGVFYQMLEIDFKLGCKHAESDRFTPWVAYTFANRGACCPHLDGATASNRTSSTNAFIFTHPPKSFTYEINTGYPMDTNIHARFKTAVVANRRLYVGNVYQGGKAHGDRMIKSPPNKFDTLPSTNFIDVTVGDGDDIVKLEAYADRLLQFKKRTLYIINIGGEVEFLESQHANMGVENPSQTCMTEFGVAWVNKFGVYLYDGQGITELTRGKLKAVDTTDRARALNVVESIIPLIGYHSLNKWLVIHIAADVSGSFESEAWVYDFKNGSWTWSQEFTAQTTADPPVAVADYKTNMINTHDNELVFAAGTNSSNTPDFFKLQASTNAITAAKLFLLTKDFTLEIPSVKKNVYSVFVTYSADASTAIQAELIYKTSSGSTTQTLTSSSALYHDTNGFQSTSEAKATIELTPSSAISNAYSFQLKLYNQDATYQTADKFKLYNISFRYRTKGVH